jgi:hypothetical protein
MRRSQPPVRIYFLFIALISVLLIDSQAAYGQFDVGHRDFRYPEDTGSNSRPTGEKPESKLWFNDGVWWGILWNSTDPTVACDSKTGSYRIHWLDLKATQDWVDTGTVVDDRCKSRVDVLWDASESQLYVASHIYTGTGAPSTKSSDWAKLYRFTYNAGTKTHTLDSGFPVNVNTRIVDGVLTGGKSETLVLAKDTKKTLWVTYVESNQVMVNRSLNSNDQTWGQPFALPGAALENSEAGQATDDISAIIAFNGHVGIMWSRQSHNNLGTPVCAGCNIHSGHEEGDTDHLTSITMNFAVHDDDADPSAWTSTPIYTPSGDDHINLKAFEGYVYGVIKTDKNAKVIELLACKTQSSACRKKSDWKHYPVFKTRDNDGNSPQADLKAASQPNPTRPILLIDTTNRELYVFANIEQSEQSSINYKKTKLDAIRFDPKDPGVPFISTTDPDAIINDPTSTKQNLDSTTGLVVLASDEETFYYFHNDLALNPPQ